MSSKSHILVIPCPFQGHINPMLQFSKRLSAKGLLVTLVTTSNITKSIQNQTQPNSIRIEHISDCSNEGEKGAEAESIEALLERLNIVFSQNLSLLIEKLSSSGFPVKLIVYDSIMPYVLDIAHQLGLHGASFFTQSCAVTAMYYHVHHGTLKIPLEESSTVSLPSMPIMGIKDLPSFIYDTGAYPSLLRLVLNQSLNFHKADWILFNTFDKLEIEVVNWMASQWSIKTIGPTVPSMYLDKRLEDDTDYGLSLFKPDAESCIKWLDARETGSVVYVSFGSLASLGEDQMEELACGLMKSNCYILWVVRDSEKCKLPGNTIMGEDTSSERILIVSWCPQLEVLAHRAVGCFVTHCGWNSTLEALSLGVPMLALPQWTDQTTNAKYIVDVWGAGVRVKVDEKGIVRREEIEKCIKEVMEGERGNEIRKNAVRWKELAKEAVDEGGTSDNNIMEFISKLPCI